MDEDWRGIDLRPAPVGWRVWCVSTEDGSAWCTPLVGWMVQEEAHFDKDRGVFVPVEVDPANRARRIVGVIYTDMPSYLWAVEASDTHWMTLGPGEADPTQQQITERADYVRWREKMRQRDAEQDAKEAAAGRAALVGAGSA